MAKASHDEETDLSVAGRVLNAFVNAVAEEEDLAEIADRLRPVLLEGKTITEAALRKALFDEAN